MYVAPLDDLLRDLLDVSLTGVIFYAPLYKPDDPNEVVDFVMEYLNPAAQRMLAMPEVPTLTHNQQWPHSIEQGSFQFHVDAFHSSEVWQYGVNYQADGYHNYYRIAARRSGRGLLVSFTNTADQPRTAVSVALREAQAAEQAARAEVEELRTHCQPPTPSCPALIFLDINMPLMGGFEFLEAYQLLPQAQQQATVIVMLTTSVSPRDTERIRHLPVAGFLPKPLTAEKVAQVLADLFPSGLRQCA